MRASRRQRLLARTGREPGVRRRAIGPTALLHRGKAEVTLPLSPSMQLSRATDQAGPTGALLLPVEAVASAEPAKTLARDDEQSSRPTESLVIAIAREANARPVTWPPAGCNLVDGVQMTGWSQVRSNGAAP